MASDSRYLRNSRYVVCLAAGSYRQLPADKHKDAWRGMHRTAAYWRQLRVTGDAREAKEKYNNARNHGKLIPRAKQGHLFEPLR
jgi:hypothetical protein